MTLADAQAELALVNDAIKNVLTGGKSSYTIAGRSAAMLPLETLRQHRRELQLIVDRLSGGSFVVAQFRCPE